MIRRLYDWALRQAAGKHAQAALFLVAFVEASFFPLPPDVLLIAMVIASREKWVRYFGICLLGSVLGGAAGYLIGLGVWEAVSGFFFSHVFSEAAFNRVREIYVKYDFWAVFTAAFTPIPYKVFTITAGVAHIDFPRFMIASLVGRGGRFILVAYLLYHFGAPVKSFIEKYFNLLTLAFMVLLIGGFVFIKYVLV